MCKTTGLFSWNGRHFLTFWLNIMLTPWGGESVHALLAMAATHTTDKLLLGSSTFLKKKWNQNVENDFSFTSLNSDCFIWPLCHISSTKSMIFKAKSKNKNCNTKWLSLTLVLLNPDIPFLCKQCRSRSVGFWRSQLIWICTVCH